MGYTIESLPLQALLPAIGRAEDRLARLDEQVRCSSVGEGFVERGHFFDAAASMWVGGELVHVEDLVLHDERMDVRAPTHELTIAHRILRARRRIASAKPGWAVSDAGIGARDRSEGRISGGAGALSGKVCVAIIDLLSIVAWSGRPRGATRGSAASAAGPLRRRVRVRRTATSRA